MKTFLIKALIMSLVKLRWLYFHINPFYVKFYMTKDEAHFQHRVTGAIYSDYKWVDSTQNREGATSMPDEEFVSLPEVVDILLEKTETGPVSEWIDRLAAVARDIGLPLCNIVWQGSPKQVAHNLAGYAFKYYSNHDMLLNHLKIR